MRDVQVIVGPGLAADWALLGEVAEREFAALGVSGALRHARDAVEARALLSSTAGGPVVAIPGPSGELRDLMGSVEGVVWCDFSRVRQIEGAAHIHGRGIDGLAWAIRHAVHQDRQRPLRVRYGKHPEQWGDLHLPAHGTADLPLPVVALVHGGYWRSVWAADLMDALCADLTARGFAAWNLEYRRPDLHGWDATTADVADGLGALSGVAASLSGARLDLGRVAVVGHSAGAQLALRAAADSAKVAMAVSLAGVLDLVEGDRRHLSSGAVAAALGGPARGDCGSPHATYAESSPLLRLPLGVPQLIVQGSGDDLDLIDFSRRYARAAEAAGDEVTYMEMSGDHFAVISPRTPIWRTTALAIADRLAGDKPAKPA
ncbi:MULTISPECIES: alpha/beta hydrolase family protein [Nonomuraea]|uniref:Alpha/beta hydrolase family protein n=1 Tax=Nonomuraea mangrovi TaxID=2316207 RepID=A0ABW4SS49_9ACTN